ncbi:MAG: PKD domain-containing protein [Verrucomicrobia bacterium]|nr:PKD domain-containing protein [Verrucomicrobiota bacterium]
MNEGLHLAEIRKPLFERLIKGEPRHAIEQALPYGLRQSLPAAFDGLVERVVSGRGNLDVLGAAPMPGRPIPAEPVQRWAQLNGERFRAYTYGARQQDVTQRGTPLWGVALGGVIAVSDEPGRVVSAQETADLKSKGAKISDPVCGVSGLEFQPGRQPLLFELGGRLSGLCSAAHGSILNGRFQTALSHPLIPSGPGGSNPTNLEPGRAVSVTQGRFNVLFMRVVFQDDPIEPISVDNLSDIMNQVNEYYRTASWNLVHMIPTITPLLMLPNTKSYYSGVVGEGGLLSDARVAAAEAGYNVSDYDLDIVGLSSVPGFDWGGLAFVGARGSWIQSFTPKVIVHELGHNLGLLHANASDTTRPPLPPQGNPPNPFDLDSLFGHHAVNADGRFVDDASSKIYDVEYGDPNDWMGQGDGPLGQFNTLHKVRLKWLPIDHVAQVTQSATNRIYAFDGPSIDSTRSYAISVRKEYGRAKLNRAYWIDHRQLLPDNPWMANGVLMYWTPWEGTKGTAQLLDMNPESANGRADAALTIGRTFDDVESDIHITPVAKGVDAGAEWIDVVVQVGPFAGNQPPTFDLVADSLFVAPGGKVRFTASNVVDPDGDAVSYYWSLNDGTFGPNSPVMTRSFTNVGHYLVRCEVSDMKGGKLSRHVLVTVGSPTTVTVGGSVRDENGQPVPNARVAVLGAGNNQYTFTDTDGTYTLVGLQSGVVTNVAFRYGYETVPNNFVNPSPVFDASGPSYDHLAVSLPMVSVQSFGSADESRGSPDAKFRFHRQGGDLASDLAVYFAVGGTATVDTDYKIKTNGVIVFPKGVDTVDLPFAVVDDKDSEGREYASVQLVLSTNLERYFNYVTNFAVTNVDMGVTNITTNVLVLIQTNNFAVPGWELRTIDGVPTWYQTHPMYVLGNDTASIYISDNEAPVSSTFKLLVFDETALEDGSDEAMVAVTRTGNPDQAVDVQITVSGTASNGVDYYLLPSTVHFDVGQTEGAIFIRAKDDLFVEGDETVVIALAPGLGYSVAGDPATVIIVDNDLPSVTVTTTQSEGRESDSVAASFTITRAGNLSSPLDVNYLLGGTATNGVDYQLMSGTATIPAGADSVAVNIQPITDSLLEAPETIELQLSASTYYNVGVPGVGRATLYDASTPLVFLTASNLATLAEGTAGGALTFTRTGPTTKPLTVNLAFAGTADRFSDYSAIGNQVTIPAGSSTLTLSLNPSDDPFPETIESIGSWSIAWWAGTRPPVPTITSPITRPSRRASWCIRIRSLTMATARSSTTTSPSRS